MLYFLGFKLKYYDVSPHITHKYVIKIGFSENYNLRADTIQVYCPFKLIKYHIEKFNSKYAALEYESYCHRKFTHRTSAKNEFRYMSDAEIEFIKDGCLKEFRLWYEKQEIV